MRARHASKSYKCTTRLIIIDTRHYYAVCIWSCTSFVHSAQYAPLRTAPHPHHTLLPSSCSPSPTPRLYPSSPAAPPSRKPTSKPHSAQCSHHMTITEPASPAATHQPTHGLYLHGGFTSQGPTHPLKPARWGIHSTKNRLAPGMSGTRTNLHKACCACRVQGLRVCLVQPLRYAVRRAPSMTASASACSMPRRARAARCACLMHGQCMLEGRSECGLCPCIRCIPKQAVCTLCMAYVCPRPALLYA